LYMERLTWQSIMLIDLMRDKFYMEPYKYFPDYFF
jgi:hypothetical protein